MDDKYYQMTKKCVSDTEGLYNVSRVKCEVEMLCNELPLSEVASLLSDLQFFASCGSEAMDSVSLSAGSASPSGSVQKPVENISGNT